MKSKRVLAGLYLIFIFAALCSGDIFKYPFPEFDETVIDLIYYSIIGGAFYVFMVFTNRKVLFYITWGISLLLNILCIYYIYLAYTMSYTLGSGAFCFLAAFLCLIINIFIPMKKEVKKENENKVNKNEEKLLEKVEDTNHKYIFANYVSGFKSLPSMIECSVTYDVDKRQLSFYIVNGEKVDNYNISCDSIKDINIKKQVLFSTNRVEPKNDEVANMLLLTAMFGNVGTLMSGSKLFNSNGNNEKTEFYDSYEIVITYLVNNEEKKIFLKTSYDPNEFFSLVKNR